ncbi:hypothetical protein ACQP1U_12665 [Actinomycetota bacterium]|nr:hypothetical protein [Micrococcales bacterium]
MPLSVTGRSAYGIRGTADLDEVWQEITAAQIYFAREWGHQTRFMRPGTAFTDDVSARLARWLGQPVVGFTVNGDGGATLDAAMVQAEVSRARPGDIVIGHMNNPRGDTALGLARAIRAMRAEGLVFRQLRELIPVS